MGELAGFQLLHVFTTFAIVIAMVGISSYTITKLHDVEDHSQRQGSYDVERIVSAINSATTLSPEVVVSLVDSQHGLENSPGFTLGDGTRDGQRKIISMDYGSSEALVQTSRGAKILTHQAQHANLVWDHDICRWHNTNDAASAPAWVPKEGRSLLPSTFTLPTGRSIVGVITEASENGEFVAVSQPDVDTITIFRRSKLLGSCGQYQQLQVLTADNDASGWVIPTIFERELVKLNFGRTLKFNGQGTMLAVAMPGDFQNTTSTSPVGSVFVYQFNETSGLFYQAFDRLHDPAVLGSVYLTDTRVLDFSNDGRGLLVGYPAFNQGRATLFKLENATHWTVAVTKTGLKQNDRLGECGGLTQDARIFIVGAPYKEKVEDEDEEDGAVYLINGLGVGFVETLVPGTVAHGVATPNRHFGSTCGIDATGSRYWGGEYSLGTLNRIFIRNLNPYSLTVLDDTTITVLPRVGSTETDNGPIEAVLNPGGNVVMMRTRNSTLQGYQIDVVDVENGRTLHTLSPPTTWTRTQKEGYGRHLSVSENGRVLWTGSGPNFANDWSALNFTIGPVTSVVPLAFSSDPQPLVVVSGNDHVKVINTETRAVVENHWTPTDNALVVASYLTAAGVPMIISASGGGGTEQINVEQVGEDALFTTDLNAVPRSVGLVHNGSQDVYWACLQDLDCQTFDSAGAEVHTVTMPSSTSVLLARATQRRSGSTLVLAVSTSSQFMIFDALTGEVENNGTLAFASETATWTRDVKWSNDGASIYVAATRTGVADYIFHLSYPELAVVKNITAVENACLSLGLSHDGAYLACAVAGGTSTIISTADGLSAVTNAVTRDGSVVAHNAVGWTSDGLTMVTGDTNGNTRLFSLNAFPLTTDAYA